MIHQTIKEQVKEALRARDTIRLDTLRGLSALIQNEMIAGTGKEEFLSDDKVLALIKRSVKQRRDSIEQFRKGGREDLVAKEAAELKILEAYMPTMMSRQELKIIIGSRLSKMKSEGTFDPKAAGKLTGAIMKELAGKADGGDVKAVLEDIMKDMAAK
ncbi:MAG: GatB/YqeY domain-containing protein [Candidatus Paceibacterota bacterium]